MSRCRSIVVAGIFAAAVAPVIALAALAAAGAPDLDVHVAAGTPLDWTPLTPQRYVRPEGAFELARSGDGGRYASPTARPTLPVLGIAQPSELLTVDFANHLNWAAPATTGSGASVTGNRSALGHAWPLPFDEELYWRASGLLLQAMLHPGRVLRSEIGARLLLLGEGARAGIEAGGSLPEVADLASALRRSIGPMPLRPLPPTGDFDPSTTLLRRFVAEELCAARPYSNDFRFGRRLALLREEALPIAAQLADSDAPLLRRNAVAFLGMIDTTTSTEALTRVVATSDDPVARARAIDALGRRRARGAAPVLRAALASKVDPFLAALLVHALGSFGDASAIALLVRPNELLTQQAEPLVGRLCALARIEPGRHTSALADFIAPYQELTQAVRSLAEVDRPDHSPDVPDPPDLRARAIVQLARLIAWRLAPDDAARARLAVQPFDEPSLAGGRLTRFESPSFGGVAPLARHVFVDVLGELGDAGSARLRKIAADVACEPELRLAAVAGLPNPDRLDVAAAMALDSTNELPWRLALLELLDRANDLRALEVARSLIGADGLRLLSPKLPEEHWRLLLVVQVLGRRHKLANAELIAALQSTDPEAPRASNDLTAWVDAFLDDAVAIGPKRLRLRKLAAELMERLVTTAAMPRRSDEEVAQQIEWLAGQAEAAIEHPKQPEVRAAARDAILDHLEASRRAPRSTAVERDLFAEIPLRETLLMELARQGGDDAVEALAARARNAHYPEQAASCVALGATQRPDVAPRLAYLLRADDPFVRLCAWLSLRRLTSQDWCANWIDGDPAEREAAYVEWARFLATSRR